ncbi:MAG TPA: ferritin-like protein [Usitatibacter sp.]|nr:ferritin-like protein [Usitatibacter sp.]
MSAASRKFHREQLLHLLAESAEIEHNLLCTYLYAAFSLKGAADASLEGREGAAVESWRRSIMTIAFEEMTHLAIIANLTVAVGGRPHFNRPNLPVPPGYHPSDLVVRLAPFDMDTLDHFIFLERPAGMELPDGRGFVPETPYERSASSAGRLMPHADDYRTVTDFYERVSDALASLARDMGERVLFCGDPAMQVGPGQVAMPGLTAVTDLRSALRAIDTIIVQGEGASAAADDSHFARFRSMKEEYAALCAARSTFRPARAVATNPVMRRPLASDRVHVDARPAAEVLDLSNALYNLMLRLLTQAFARVDGGSRKVLLDQAIRLMRAFAATSTYLTTLPASAAAPGLNAGATFTVLRATETLPEGPGEWVVLGERVNGILDSSRALAASASELTAVVKELEAVGAALARQARGGPTP